MIKPYYQEENITIYNGDCLEVMKKLSDKSIDLVLTDPPYGINMDSELNKKQGKYGYKNYGDTSWDNRRPSKEYINEIFRVSKNQTIWGGNYFIDYLYPSMGWIVWDKGQRDFSLADGELAWTSFNKALRIFSVPRGKVLKDNKVHPTQKSLEVIRRCILYADRALGKEVSLILDPFLGSGTTARACKDLNRKCIGIEISQKYCDIAVKRLGQEVFNFKTISN